MERAGGGEECYSQANSDKHLGTLTKPNGLATTRFSPRIKERRRVLFDDRTRRSDAEARRKACRPKGGPEKARLPRCRASAYHLDRPVGSTPCIRAFSGPSRGH